MGELPNTAVRCSKLGLPSGPPSLFFVGNATDVTRDAPVRGAGERLEESFSGSVLAQSFAVDRIGGTDVAQVPSGARHVFVVPWGYSADCTPTKWPSREWVEPGVSGLVYGQLRAREHWVEGVPTIDTHDPYQLPYPRRSSRSRSITADDAFKLLSLLPGAGELETRGVEALLPLAAWISERPELAAGEPGRAIRSFLVRMTHTRIRDLEPEVAGTYRFVLDVGDGLPRTFYGRTEPHPVTPHRMEAGTAFMDELRPPRADGYALLVAVAGTEDDLPAHRDAGRYGYMYVDLVSEVSSDGTRSWSAGAELTLLRHALPADTAVQRIARLGPRELRLFLQHNVPPGSDAAFRMLPDGRVTFEQRYQLSDGAVAVLRGERISTAVMPEPH